jgi:quercetin dioxygenase-like cupin family protein
MEMEMSGVRVSGKAEGEALWFLDTLMQVKLSASDTGGTLSILEQTAPPGSGTPLHRHDRTDEHFYVLAGDVVFYGEAGSQRCGPGSFVSVPRGTVHAFRVDEAAPARLLVLSSPGHFEGFVRSVSRPAEALDVPPAGPPPGPEAIASLVGIGAEHDTIVVGPPPAT